MIENPGKIIVDITCQGFTAVSCSLHKFFTNIEFSRYIRALFDAKSSTSPQRAEAVQLANFGVLPIFGTVGFC